MYKWEDVQEDVYTSGVPGARFSMRLTHLATGKHVSGAGFVWIETRKRLYAELMALVEDERRVQEAQCPDTGSGGSSSRTGQPRASQGHVSKEDR